MLGVRWYGVERVPTSGPLLLAPNHRSYLDPPITGCGVYRELHFFAKAELFGVPVLGPVIRNVFNSIPIRRGEADRKSLATAIGAVKDGGGLVLFPEGTRAPRDGFLSPKLGVGLIAARSGATVVPVYISETGGGWGAVWRAVFRRTRIRVLYGHPMTFETGSDRDRAARYGDIAAEVMAAVRGLRDEMEAGAPGAT